MAGKKPKKCEIDKADKVFIGNGGSNAIVVITRNNQVYKIFTIYYYSENFNSNARIKQQNNEAINEIKIQELLTKKIGTIHIVKAIDSYECDNAKLLFKSCPKVYTEFLKLKQEKKTQLCKTYFNGYPTKKLYSKSKVLKMEHCDYSCAAFIEDISKFSINKMREFLDIFFFQIIYTITIIQKTFPYFLHGDLFMRNIMGKKEKDRNYQYVYDINGKNYYVPQKKFLPKIADFGYSNLNQQHSYSKLKKSEYRDIYNIILDVYNGQNLGAKSLRFLCQKDDAKKAFLDEYFSNFFNVKIIKKYIENSPGLMRWNWEDILDEKFRKSIQMKGPNELLNGYFYRKFGQMNKKAKKFIVVK